MSQPPRTCPRRAVLLMAGMALAATVANAQTAAPAQGPDPREIPIPEIKTDLGKMPGVNELPVRAEMPDPMVMNDGAKVTTPEQWKKRREEIKRTLEYYAVGEMPPPPGNVKGVEVTNETVPDGRVKYRLVHLTFGPKEKLSLDIGIFTPLAGGPFPTIILQSGTPPDAKALPRLPGGPNQGRGQDVLMMVGPAPGAADSGAADRRRDGESAQVLATRNSEVFRRGYALVVYNANDCAEDTTLRNEDGSWAFRNTRFFPAYPGYDWGILAAWAWGASRIADYLETDPAIDNRTLIITGWSRNGKSSMIAAAFDQRLLGAPAVTGGGGIGAYRFAGPRKSETLDIMQKKYPNWFSPHLHEFWGQREKLPFDEHWFLALAAPRPFIALEGDADRISLPDAVEHSILAAQKVYEFLGAKDNIGVHYSRHGHAFTQEDWVAMMDFFDKYSRGMKVDRTFDHFLTDAERDAAMSAKTPKTFNVRDFGAAGDGTNKDTVAFQEALDACAVSGGGDVIVPAGKYLIGSVQMGNRTILRLQPGSVITGSPDAADYPMLDIRWEGRWQPGRRALIYSANVDRTGIIGPGRIEGNPGMAAPQNPRGSVVLEPISCDDVRWEGFSVTQGGNWAIHPTYCNGVEITNINIRGGRDGIDIDSCKNIRIENCDVDTGDDSISIKSGRGMDGARIGKPTEDVLISHCALHCRRFACLGIGSETSGGVRNVRIEHCKLSAPRSCAIYIKSRIGRAGVNENIEGGDLNISEGGFLRVNLVSAGNTNTADDPVPGFAGIPEGRNFKFSDIRVAGGTLADVTRISAEKPLQGLVLENISGACARGISLQHVSNAVLSGIHVTVSTGPLLATNDVTGKGLEFAEEYTPPPPRGARQAPAAQKTP
ncbi:MAG: glycosyl hydrolase family 28 protein [Limisphaerales bacterium]